MAYIETIHSRQFDTLTNLIKLSQVQTILIVGDEGVGKKTLVRRVLGKLDKCFVIECPEFGIDDARSLKYQSIRKFNIPRYCLIDGDHATDAAYNAVLKLLEEPPPDIYFIICSSKQPLQTVVSRCSYLMVPPMTEIELYETLLFRGMSELASKSIIPYARGSVTEAFKVYGKLEEKRRLVPFIKALKDRDITFVLKQTKTIQKQDIALMAELVEDVCIARYGLMNQELANLLPANPDFLLKVRKALLDGRSPALCWLRAYFATE